MIGLFKTAINKPIARSIHKFSQFSSAKWVPINKSFVALTKTVLRAACERLDLTQVVITLGCVTHQDYRHLLLANDERDLQVAAGLQVEEFIIAAQDLIGSSGVNFDADAALSLPIDFKSPHGESQRLGYLVAQYSGEVNTETLREKLHKELEAVAAEIVRIIGRYQTRYRAIHVYGDQGFWIGNSRALRQLDQRMDQLAKGSAPVLIRADKGTGKVIAARSLHCIGRPELAPFIESDCKDWERGNAANILRSLHSFANGGTLFLRNVDLLGADDFLHLQAFWGEASRREFSGISLKLVMSLSAVCSKIAPDLRDWLAQQARELVLPSLDERRDDIRDLTRFFIREFAVSKMLTVNDDAWALLESARWPGNVEQLKQVIKKLVLIAEDTQITANDLRPLL